MKTAEIFFSLLRYLRSAGRQFIKEPLMTSVAIVSLSVALGAGTYIFGLANLLLLTPPALEEPAKLVDIGRTTQGHGFDTWSYPNYRDVAEQSRLLDGMYAYTRLPTGMYENNNAARADTMLVTGNYFDVLGVQPAIGRLLQTADAPAPGEGDVVVVSHAAFEKHLGGDASRIGKTLELNGVSFTLVGVLPEHFKGTGIEGAAEFYVPLTMAQRIGRLGGDYFDQRRANWLHAGGRMRDEVSVAQLKDELQALTNSLQAEYPVANENIGFTAAPMRMLPAPMRMPLMIFTGLLFGLVGLVLLVAASNVASLLIARGESRRHELAMRHVLGARRRAIIMQLMTEVFVLTLAAGVLGLLIAAWARGVVAAVELPIPIALDLNIPFDWRVFGFVLAASFITSLLAGLLPAFRVSRQQPREVIGGSTTQIAGSRSVFRNLMVTAQVAFTLLLLIVAGLFISALQRASDVELGYDINNMHAATLDLRSNSYDNAQRNEIITRVLERLQQDGRVQSAAAAAVTPLFFSRMGYGGFLLGDGESLDADANIVTPGFFDALRIPVRGRGIESSDTAGSERVVVINQVLADKLAPGGDVIGRSFSFGDPEDPWMLRVVGVTPDARYSRLDDTNIPFMYLPVSQVPQDEMSFLIRSSLNDREMKRLTASAVRQVDPRLTAPDVISMAAILDFSLLPQRIAGGVALTLGTLGLLLAMLGLYGLLAGHVASRTRELGVRLTLGAQPRRLMRNVLWRGLRLTAGGMFVGLVLAMLLAGLLDGYLFGLDAFDGLVFVAAILVLSMTALFALLIPAGRVLRIQPQEALRHE